MIRLLAVCGVGFVSTVACGSSGGDAIQMAADGGEAGAVDIGPSDASTAPPSDAGPQADGVATQPDAGGSARPGWMLTWSDEFNGAAGPIDGTHWGFDVGGNGWGNNELEYYTNRVENVAVDGNGALNIHVLAEPYMNRNYTSARINTNGKFSQAYGRFEARIQIPSGHGLWPAFWTLGNNIAAVQWPTCGELDIMENVGKEPAINHGSAHGPGYSGGNPLTATYKLPNGNLADAYHVYAIEWEPNVVRWYVDDTLYETRTPADVPQGKVWVYDHPFFIILNVAVGGQFPGPPDGTTQFPQTMRVDYVRVYKKL